MAKTFYFKDPIFNYNDICLILINIPNLRLINIPNLHYVEYSYDRVLCYDRVFAQCVVGRVRVGKETAIIIDDVIAEILG